MISMTSRQRITASPGGARVGDITVELILSYSYGNTPRQPKKKEEEDEKKTKIQIEI